MPEPLLTVEDLSLSFLVEGEARPVVRDLSFEVHPGETLGLVGESGSGKSTVLLAIMKYLAANARIESGRILFQGLDMLAMDRAALDRLRGRHIAMVYQDPGTALNPSMTVGAQIAETVRKHLGLDDRDARRRTLDVLERVHLDDPERLIGAYSHQLSGGMRQRAMIALALCCDPDLVLMDEPTTALDVIVQARILALVREICGGTGAGAVFVTHDLGAVVRVADRVGVLYAGELMELGATRQVLGGHRNPYTAGLIAALPRVSARLLPKAIPGMISRDPARFRCCVFASRCPAAAEICESARPASVEVASGWLSRCHFAADPDRLGRSGDRGAALDERAGPGGGTAEPSLLELDGVAVDYVRPRGLVDVLTRRGGRTVKAVRGVSLSLRPGRTVAVVGESGSGKTTLAHAILRLLPLSAGRVRFGGADIGGFSGGALRDYRRLVQIVFQNPTSSLNPRKTVEQLIARPLILTGSRRAEAHRRAAEVLPEVGLDESYLGRLPSELSGGEKQRVAIARAFVTEPKLVILDEPTTSLDVSVQATVLGLLARLQALRRCAYLLISHDLALVRQLADDIVVMRAGEVCETGPAEAIFGRPTHPYTRELLAAVPRVEAAA